MAAPMLRPLNAGEILDAGIKVVTRNWKPLIGSLLVVTTPVQIVSAFVLASVDQGDTSFQIIPDTSQPAQNPGADFFIAVGISSLLTGIAFLLAFTALFKGVADAWLGAHPTIGRSLGYGLRRWPKVLLLWLVWVIPISVFTLACLLPGIWLGTVWALSIPALLFERIGPVRSLGRSFGLVQGRFWECLAVVLVGGLLVEVIGAAIQFPLRLVADSASNGNEIANAIALVVSSLLATSISYPYMAAVLTILYFDQRVRKEGLDIQLLAEGLGVERDPNAPLPMPLAQGQPQWGPPPPQWQPPPPYGPPGGWAPPSAAHAPPLRWGPAAPEPVDDRPAEESPWMTPNDRPPEDVPEDRWRPSGSEWKPRKDEDDEPS